MTTSTSEGHGTVTRERRLYEIQAACRIKEPLTYFKIMGCYPETPYWVFMKIK